MERRLLFTSILLLFDQYQMQLAFMLAVCFVALSREVGAWWYASSDYLSYYCAWNVLMAIVALLLMDVEKVRGDKINQALLSIVLILTNVVLIGITFFFNDDEIVG